MKQDRKRYLRYAGECLLTIAVFFMIYAAYHFSSEPTEFIYYNF